MIFLFVWKKFKKKNKKIFLIKKFFFLNLKKNYFQQKKKMSISKNEQFEDFELHYYNTF